MSQILTTSFIHIHRQYGSYLVYLVSTISLLLHAKMPPATHREWKLNGRQSFDCLKLNKDIPTPSPKGSEVLIQGKPLPTCAGILRTNAYSQGCIAELPRRCDRIREIPSTRQRRLDAFIRRSWRGSSCGTQRYQLQGWRQGHSYLFYRLDYWTYWRNTKSWQQERWCFTRIHDGRRTGIGPYAEQLHFCRSIDSCVCRSHSLERALWLEASHAWRLGLDGRHGRCVSVCNSSE
jgi:hypothetical protein